MEQKNKKTSNRLAIIAACIAIMLSISAIVGGTLALFSADVAISNNVLQAGSLSVKLERTSLQVTAMDGQGVVIEGDDVKDEPAKDFTNSSENVFGLGESDLIVPGSKYIATMKLTNTGTVAFDFVASLQITDDDADAKLSEQLTLKLIDESGEEVQSGTVYAGTNNTCVFKIVLEFNDLEDNNDVMDAGAKINLLIQCAQKVGE